jgi:hypothetical protein
MKNAIRRVFLRLLIERLRIELWQKCEQDVGAVG